MEEMRSFGYICPECGKPVIASRSVFALTAAAARMECACEKSTLEVQTDGLKFRLWVPCGLCGKTHQAECSADAVLRGRGVGLACPETGQLCCFIGSEEEVERQMKELEIRAEKEKSESPEAFTDNVIMYEVLSELRDIASRGGVQCGCGSSDYGIHVRRDAVDLTCSRCGRAAADPRRDGRGSRPPVLPDEAGDPRKMSALVCFAVFLAGVAVCLHMGWALIWAMLLGIAAFGALGLRRGFSLRTLWGFAWGQGRKMCSLLVIYVLIGMITALWRSAGTIAWFIYHGLQIITPQLFILVTFALTCFLSYALGTSFGVVGTAGIIVMALARSGGVSTAVTAGAIVAGRISATAARPRPRAASLVAAATGTKLEENLRAMHRTLAAAAAERGGIRRALRGAPDRRGGRGDARRAGAGV